MRIVRKDIWQKLTLLAQCRLYSELELPVEIWVYIKRKAFPELLRIRHNLDCQSKMMNGKFFLKKALCYKYGILELNFDNYLKFRRRIEDEYGESYTHPHWGETRWGSKHVSTLRDLRSHLKNAIK